MKRSEMVNIIEKFINKKLIFKEYTEIWLNSNKYVDELLMLIENNGMSAPNRGEYFDCFTWESENEQEI